MRTSQNNIASLSERITLYAAETASITEILAEDQVYAALTPMRQNILKAKLISISKADKWASAKGVAKLLKQEFLHGLKREAFSRRAEMLASASEATGDRELRKVAAILRSYAGHAITNRNLRLVATANTITGQVKLY